MAKNDKIIKKIKIIKKKLIYPDETIPKIVKKDYK